MFDVTSRNPTAGYLARPNATSFELQESMSIRQPTFGPGQLRSTTANYYNDLARAAFMDAAGYPRTDTPADRPKPPGL
jgi:hypothetical protein